MLLCCGALGGAGQLLAVSVGRVSPWCAAHGGVPLVILPKVIPVQWLQNLLHNQRALINQAALLFKPRVIVTAVPYHLER